MIEQQEDHIQNTNFWREHIAAFIASGKTQKEYCRDNSLKYTTFKGQRYKFTKEFPANKKHHKAMDGSECKAYNAANSKSPSKFATITVFNKKPDKTETIKLHLNSNIYLELPLEIDREHLNKYLNALGVI